MKNIIYLMGLLLIFGCANTSKFNERLVSMVGKNENNLFNILGYPDKRMVIDNNTIVYIWENNESGYKTKHRNNIVDGYVGDIPVSLYETKEYVVPYSYNCELKFVVRNGIVITWEWEGNMGACKKYINRVNGYKDSVFNTLQNNSSNSNKNYTDPDNFVSE